MRKIGEISLSEPLIIAIQQAGSRKLVLVEGDEDQDVFERHFKKHLSQIYFYDCGGVGHVLKYFEELKREAISKDFFCIRDRDFLDEEQVENSYSENSHLFVLRWYCIENYLLNEQIIFDELCTKHTKNKRTNIGLNAVEDITNYFDQLKRELATITAADWIIAEFNENRAIQNSENTETERVAYFSEGFSTNSETVINQFAQKLGLLVEKAIELIENKKTTLSGQDSLHTKYNGKRLLHWICKKFKFPDDYHFKRLLISRLTAENIPINLKEIIEDRILKLNSQP